MKIIAIQHFNKGMKMREEVHYAQDQQFYKQVVNISKET